MATESDPSLESSRYGEMSQDELESSFHDRFSSEPTSIFSSSTTASRDRLEELERIHEETMKKLKELQRTLDQKMADHESEIEEMLAQKEEIESELASSKREEKELRLKDVRDIFIHCLTIHILSILFVQVNSTRQLNAVCGTPLELRLQTDRC
jgi:seryl-tRNA synthetase